MKTIKEWLQKYATTSSMQFELRDLIREVRREAFERCEQAARQCDIYGDSLRVADLIAKVYREEGEK